MYQGDKGKCLPISTLMLTLSLKFMRRKVRGGRWEKKPPISVWTTNSALSSPAQNSDTEYTIPKLSAYELSQRNFSYLKTRWFEKRSRMNLIKVFFWSLQLNLVYSVFDTFHCGRHLAEQLRTVVDSSSRFQMQQSFIAGQVRPVGEIFSWRPDWHAERTSQHQKQSNHYPPAPIVSALPTWPHLLRSHSFILYIIQELSIQKVSLWGTFQTQSITDRVDQKNVWITRGDLRNTEMQNVLVSQS